MTFKFEWHSNLSDNSIWVTFHLEWHFILSDIPFAVTFHWVTFHFGWHSILSDIPFWVIFHFVWHSIWVAFNFEWIYIFSDIPFWVTFHFEWHSILSAIPFWVTGWCFNLNDENWVGIGLSISNLCVSLSVTIIRPRDASASKNLIESDEYIGIQVARCSKYSFKLNADKWCCMQYYNTNDECTCVSVSAQTGTR